MIWPGCWIDAKASRASIMICRCKRGSLGFPAVRPRGKSRWMARGGLTERVIEWALDRQTVGRPRFSSSRAISPTDWWQTGQTGTRMARSTSSLSNRSAMAGASASRTLRTE